MQFYIKDNFYFDIDLHNQLRISGPENHLFLGMTFPETLPVELHSFGMKKNQLEVIVTLDTQHLKLPIPIVTDIRTLRSLTEQVHPRPLYSELLSQAETLVKPRSITHTKENDRSVFQFINEYTDGEIKKHYGCQLNFGPDHQVTLRDGFLHIKVTKSPIVIRICTETNLNSAIQPKRSIFNSAYSLPKEFFSSEILDLYDKSRIYIDHLLKSNKTSSFEYGTIFPRDWIESADLGSGDLSQETVDYMYQQSLQHVSENGEGWHEDLIGEYRTKVTNTTEHVDRKMIDIEPRYILGIKRMSKELLTQPEIQQTLRRVAKFVIKQATENELISFKKVAPESDDYHIVGNWRDSVFAYPRQKSPLSPYDVNCVFYPEALRVMKKYHEYLDLPIDGTLTRLIKKWSSHKGKYRLYHSKHVLGYSLALHGKKQLPLPIAHLDESYDLVYGSPSLEEIASFAEKIIDPNYFYTPVGPLLVDVDSEEFTTEHYHGKVIWPKQAAYAVAGLTLQFRRGLKQGWPTPVIELIKSAIITTAEACFQGWKDLGVVPELYYYDEETKKARLYTDQPKYEGQMSLIQLWSSVGCRRIIQDYAMVKKIAENM